MGLNIVIQTNEQECGVCALTALHNYFYKSNLSKEQALNNSVISDEGMTIFDFETLGHQLGIECESYEVKFAEFQNLKINNYFVLLLATNGSNNHYVVARKRKGYIEIYDSCSLKMNKITYNELKQVFLNVLILVKKKPNDIFQKIFSTHATLLMFDLKFVLINLCLSVLIMAVSIGTAVFLNFVIDLAISKESINNLITICFIFTLFYFMNDILQYVSSLYMSKHVKNYFILFTSKILSSLEYKQSDFLKKVDKNWIFKIDECVYNIANFSIVEINKLITNIIFLFVCICIIGSIQYFLLFFVILYAIIELIFFLFSYRKKKEVFLQIIHSENSNSEHFKQLIISLKNEMWFAKRQSIITKIKNNYSNIYKNYGDVILFKNNSHLFKGLLKSFCEICVIATMSYFVIKQNKLSIGKLVFVISAFGLYKTATADLFNYFLLKLEFNVYWQVYKDITTIGNIQPSLLTSNEQIKEISFQLDSKCVTLKTNSSTSINSSLLELFKEAKIILLNNKKIEVSQEFIKSLIIVDQHALAHPDLLINNIQLDPQLYSQYIRYFQLDLNKSIHSFDDSIVINLLCLLNEKHKLIFIDDILKYIAKKDKLVVKQMLSKIRKSNTVFILGKEEND